MSILSSPPIRFSGDRAKCHNLSSRALTLYKTVVSAADRAGLNFISRVYTDPDGSTFSFTASRGGYDTWNGSISINGTLAPLFLNEEGNKYSLVALFHDAAFNLIAISYNSSSRTLILLNRNSTGGFDKDGVTSDLKTPLFGYSVIRGVPSNFIRKKSDSLYYWVIDGTTYINEEDITLIENAIGTGILYLYGSTSESGYKYSARTYGFTPKYYAIHPSYTLVKEIPEITNSYSPLYGDRTNPIYPPTATTKENAYSILDEIGNEFITFNVTSVFSVGTVTDNGGPPITSATEGPVETSLIITAGGKDVITEGFSTTGAARFGFYEAYRPPLGYAYYDSSTINWEATSMTNGSERMTIISVYYVLEYGLQVLPFASYADAVAYANAHSETGDGRVALYSTPGLYSITLDKIVIDSRYIIIQDKNTNEYITHLKVTDIPKQAGTIYTLRI